MPIMKGLWVLAALSIPTRAQKDHVRIGYADKSHGEDWYDCGPYGGKSLYG